MTEAEGVSVTIRPPPSAMLLAARSGGRVGGRVSGGGGGYGGGGRYGGGGGYSRGPTNVYVAPPPIISPFGFSPFGFSPFGFSPFGFGFGFGLPAPLLLFAVGGLALTSFRSNRGIEAGESAGCALCLQVACYCEDREASLAGKLQRIARTADANSYEGLQTLVSDTCLAILRTSKDWLAARTVSSTASFFANDVDSTYNKLVVQVRARKPVSRLPAPPSFASPPYRIVLYNTIHPTTHTNHVASCQTLPYHVYSHHT